MEANYLSLERLAGMTEEGLLDLLGELRTICRELEKVACRETERAKLEISEAIARVESELNRRELSAQT